MDSQACASQEEAHELSIYCATPVVYQQGFQETRTAHKEWQSGFRQGNDRNHATLFMTMQKHGNSERYAGKVYYHLHNEVLNDFGCIKEISKVKKVLGVSKYIVDTLDTYLKDHGEPGLREDQKAVWRNGVDTSGLARKRLIARRLNFERNSI